VPRTQAEQFRPTEVRNPGAASSSGTGGEIGGGAGGEFARGKIGEQANGAFRGQDQVFTEPEIRSVAPCSPSAT
jgi:hypothetical protein